VAAPRGFSAGAIGAAVAVDAAGLRGWMDFGAAQTRVTPGQHRETLRVLVVAYVFPPIAYAGSYRTLRLCKYLARAGHDVSVITIEMQKDIDNDPQLLDTVDKSIPVRLLSYIMLLYDVIYKESKAGLLSNIFPILLYNGKDDWNIPLNVNELIDKNIPAKYIPSFEYYLIVEKDIPNEVLDELSNLVAAVVYLEKQNDVKKLPSAIEKVLKYIQNEKIIDVKVFATWFTKMFRASIEQKEIDKIKDITETKSMLTLLAEEIRKEGRIEGKIEGIIEAAKKMKKEGFDFHTINRITGLTFEEIEKL